MGVDGEQSELKAAADRTDRRAAWTGDAPLDAVITFTGDPTAPLRLPAGLAIPWQVCPHIHSRRSRRPRPAGGCPRRGTTGDTLCLGRLGAGRFRLLGARRMDLRPAGDPAPARRGGPGEGRRPGGRRGPAAGDVLFFADSTGYVHHEGIYIGGDRMFHAPQSGDVVKVERIDIGSFARTYAGARRFSPSA